MQQAANLSEKTIPFVFMHASDAKLVFARRKLKKVSGSAVSVIGGCLTLLCLQLSPSLVIFHRHLSSRSLLSFASYHMLLPCKHSISPGNPFLCLSLIPGSLLLAGDAPGCCCGRCSGRCRSRAGCAGCCRAPPPLLRSPTRILLAQSLQQMCMINGLFTFGCLIIIFLPLTFSLLQIYFGFEILGIPLITFMFIGEVAIIRLFFPFFLILVCNYIFPSAF